MTSRRPFVTLAVAAALLVACSSSTSSVGTSTTRVATTDTATADTTDTSTATTDTTATADSAPHPEIRGLALSSKGLGSATFGTGVDAVLHYVTAILGTPTGDTGWTDPTASGAACPGTTVRFVTWHDLTLMFTDQSPAATGVRHFASYSYGPAAGTDMDPWGLTTSGGIGVGSTVEDLQSVYPSVVINTADDMGGPSFFIEDGLTGFLTGTGSTDQVISFVGGSGCGE